MYRRNVVGIISTLSLLLVFNFSYAEDDCPLKTEPRKLQLSPSLIQEEKLNPVKGTYTASLKSGDAVLANYATCSLSMQAHYLIHKETEPSDLMYLLNRFSGSVLFNSEMREKAKKIIQASSLDNIKNKMVVDGQQDSHQFTIIPIENEFFSYRIFYQWIPPEV